MITSKVEYLGNLRTSALHIKSNNEIITDAPVDNHGKGEAFSPTDLVATALASCMLTMMGIKADNLGVNLSGTTAEVTKIMGIEPRRIVEIHVNIKMSYKYDEKIRILLEKAALTCPVAKSLDPNLIQLIKFV